MSVHTYTLLDGRNIMCGWDRPLQEYFLTVFGPEPEDPNADEPIIYSAISDGDWRGRGVLPDPEAITNKLNELGMPVPTGMIERVIQDQVYNVMNTHTDWTTQLPAEVHNP
jgi:hypothetical protein